jgi:hypothetical protein
LPHVYIRNANSNCIVLYKAVLNVTWRLCNYQVPVFIISHLFRLLPPGIYHTTHFYLK